MPHRPRKRFGQHFLHDPQIISRIIEGIAPQPQQRLVEIGPGQGALTFPLLQRVAHLDVVEIDRDLIAYLRQQAPEQLTLHAADALRFEFCGLCHSPQERLRLIGNLPYNISTPLLFHLLTQKTCIDDMHFMLQKEVVDRMLAPPGSKTYGRLSVMVQYHCALTPLFDIGPGAFNPPPKVYSSVVRLVPHPRPPVNCDPNNLQTVVTHAFSQRRKTLRNALRRWFSPEQIQALGIDPGLRPEMLGLVEFAALANTLPVSTA
ncbi:MAG: 16S rRNA (adenine(1518)-N(6)/adenine(1519)-N(6))-dimethyltransferase RsmA [Gammaproteobacteria bacterium]|nr:16S rRNA (adenine(1518)-N(6)/adenine(1519)-N(6))-dimethyltransferase RsmA [Gammaproteobacteria bacterium]